MSYLIPNLPKDQNLKAASLVLSSGMKFHGESIGAPKSIQGELVFTTGMVGYTQSLTDPSYCGQILVFTYPLIGNYGVPNLELGLHSTDCKGFESSKIQASAVILASGSDQAFHWQSRKTLSEWLKQEGVPGIAGVDTRQLTQIIRSSPELTATLSLGNNSVPPPRSNSCLLSHVSIQERMILGKGRTRIALVDCGVKSNIIRQLLTLGCEVELLPWNTDLSQIDCTAWLLSNGPGDPKNTGDLIASVRGLIHSGRPIFGICLGYQILALAAGAETARLPFGHRGHNHSVQLVGTQKGFMTSQNHGYYVIEKTLPEEWSPWFRHLNDETLEGIRHRSLPLRGVQFHPEGAAGPQDTAWLLEEFIQELR